MGPTRPIDRVRTALVRTMRTTRHHLRGPRANRAPGYIYAQRGPGVSVLCGGLYSRLKTLEMNALAAFVTRGARPGLSPVPRARAPPRATCDEPSVDGSGLLFNAIFCVGPYCMTVPNIVSIFERCSGPSSDHGATLKSICDHRR